MSKFSVLKGKLAKEKGVTNPGGLAAFIGRKKLGKKKFQQKAAKGRKRKKLITTGPNGRPVASKRMKKLMGLK